MKRASFLIPAAMLLSTMVYGQAPSAPAPAATPPAATPARSNPAPAQAAPTGVSTVKGGSRFAVINFMDALGGTIEGKKVAEQLNAQQTKLQAQFQAKQKEGADLTAKLNTDKTLTDIQKAGISKSIDSVSTELQRMQEDFQKQMSDLQQQLLTPIADKIHKEVEAYGAENGLALIIDTSGQTDNVVYSDPIADITTEIIRRADAAAAKAPAAKPPATTPLRPPAGTPATPGRATPPATPGKPPAPSL